MKSIILHLYCVGIVCNEKTENQNYYQNNDNKVNLPCQLFVLLIVSKHSHLFII